MRSPRVCPEPVPALEALDRLESVRTVADAVLAGHWALNPEVLDATGAVLASAARWAELVSA